MIGTPVDTTITVPVTGALWASVGVPDMDSVPAAFAACEEMLAERLLKDGKVGIESLIKHQYAALHDEVTVSIPFIDWPPVGLE